MDVCKECLRRGARVLTVHLKGERACARCGQVRQLFRVEAQDVLAKAPDPQPSQNKEDPSPFSRVTDIENYQAIHARHGTYVRELQRLAIEVERLLPLIDDVATGTRGDGPTYVAQELRKCLVRVCDAGELDGPKEKKS